MKITARFGQCFPVPPHITTAQCVSGETDQVGRQESVTFVAECQAASLFDVLTSTSPASYVTITK